MKQILVLFFAVLFIACSDNKVFLLKDNNSNKYFLSDSIHKMVKSKKINHSPIFIIDGVQFKYNNHSDTVLLPLAKKDLYLLTFLNKHTASNIYGYEGSNGAVLISTKPNPK